MRRWIYRRSLLLRPHRRYLTVFLPPPSAPPLVVRVVWRAVVRVTPPVAADGGRSIWRAAEPVVQRALSAPIARVLWRAHREIPPPTYVEPGYIEEGYFGGELLSPVRIVWRANPASGVALETTPTRVVWRATTPKLVQALQASTARPVWRATAPTVAGFVLNVVIARTLWRAQAPAISRRTEAPGPRMVWRGLTLAVSQTLQTPAVRLLWRATAPIVAGRVIAAPVGRALWRVTVSNVVQAWQAPPALAVWLEPIPAVSQALQASMAPSRWRAVVPTLGQMVAVPAARMVYLGAAATTAHAEARSARTAWEGNTPSVTVGTILPTVTRLRARVTLRVRPTHAHALRGVRDR